MREWFVVAHQAEVAHHLAPETRIQQMQDGVLDATDVLINRHPFAGFRIDHAISAALAGEARVVPAGIHEGIHGVGFTPRRLTAFGTGAVDEVFTLAEWV